MLSEVSVFYYVLSKATCLPKLNVDFLFYGLGINKKEQGSYYQALNYEILLPSQIYGTDYSALGVPLMTKRNLALSVTGITC